MILKAGMAFLRILFWLGWSLNFLFGWLALATESMWFSILQPDILTKVLPLQILKCPSLTEWFLDWWWRKSVLISMKILCLVVLHMVKTEIGIHCIKFLGSDLWLFPTLECEQTYISKTEKCHWTELMNNYN